ncbi:hypothetical protein [Natronosalvus rutilus]|uniref:Uncharacterized protein n=1 Tax=Natronosalvus rutilus TaxID=2953753 RepID=A0A9E7NCN1_9EURY|nr:hypothetical protein [Natronosalvus rutilus]UTF55994.1 hypothetical protein NGM29_20620 [Natronosalvus rutilus]
MAMSQPGPRLRFDAGRHEESVIGLIVLVQITLAAVLFFLLLVWAHLIIGALMRPPTDWTGAFVHLGFLAVMGLVVYLLGQLYE